MNSPVEEPVAYRIENVIVCPDPECLMHYADGMQTAKPLTQADISEEQQNRDGGSVTCDSCMAYLDLWNLTNGARS
jgi:hypothetical protein